MLRMNRVNSFVCFCIFKTTKIYLNTNPYLQNSLLVNLKSVFQGSNTALRAVSVQCDLSHWNYCLPFLIHLSEVIHLQSQVILHTFLSCEDCFLVAIFARVVVDLIRKIAWPHKVRVRNSNKKDVVCKKPLKICLTALGQRKPTLHHTIFHNQPNYSLLFHRLPMFHKSQGKKSLYLMRSLPWWR